MDINRSSEATDFDQLAGFNDIEETDSISPSKFGLTTLKSPLKELHSPSQFFQSPVRPMYVRHTTPRRTPGGGVKGFTYTTAKSPAQLFKDRFETEPGTESFLTFVQSLSPLVEMKHTDLSSPLASKLSVCATAPRPSGPSNSLADLMPPIPGEGLKRRVAQKLDFEDDRIAHRLKLIEASTTATPGKEQRSVLSERKLMKMELGAQQGMSIENINANLRKAPPSRHKTKRAKGLSTPHDRKSRTFLSPSELTINRKKRKQPHSATPRRPSTKGKDRLSRTVQKSSSRAPLLYVPGSLRKGAAKGTPVKRQPCHCKKSKCLKLYCECFAAGGYCGPECKCENCANNLESEPERQIAVKQTLERNPAAFRPKIETEKTAASHVLGCHCKKSACQKKYCECFQAGILCGSNCRCTECKNNVEHIDKENYGRLIQTPVRVPKPKAKPKKATEAIPVFHLFGFSHPPLKMSIATNIMSHLSNSDLYNASLVAKLWPPVVFDSALWDYGDENNEIQ